MNMLTIASIICPFTASVDEQYLGINTVSTAVCDRMVVVVPMSLHRTPRELFIIATIVKCCRTGGSRDDRKVCLVYGTYGVELSELSQNRGVIERKLTLLAYKTQQTPPPLHLPFQSTIPQGALASQPLPLPPSRLRHERPVLIDALQLRGRVNLFHSPCVSG